MITLMPLTRGLPSHIHSVSLPDLRANVDLDDDDDDDQQRARMMLLLLRD